MEDLEPVKRKGYNISCCRSYLTLKGKCYICPEQNDKDPDYEDDY